ncbi:MAG: hypothetical protein ACYS1C_04430 [Planctomycetota bacterium]|jgi:hypothetical protein
MEGAQLGVFELLEEMGRSPCGTLYRARQVSLDREVALRVLHGVRQAPDALVTRV